MNSRLLIGLFAGFAIAACTNSSSNSNTPSTTSTGSTGTIDLELIKYPPFNADEDGSGTVTLGDTLTYSVTAINNGTATLNDIVITDSHAGPSPVGTSELEPNYMVTLQGTYVVQQADVDAGMLTTTGSVVTNEVTSPITDTDDTPVFAYSGSSANAGPCVSDGGGTPDFSCMPPGQLLSGTTTRQGVADITNWLPGMRFPIEDGPAYVNSQLYRPKDGGIPAYSTSWIGPDGQSFEPLQPNFFYQCDTRNYAFPWQDNFCERRDNGDEGYQCPTSNSGGDHLGIDIRGAVCQANEPANTLVATVDGQVEHVANHYVQISNDDESFYFNYIHMHDENRTFTGLSDIGSPVTREQPLGRIGKKTYDGRDLTTWHLHFEMKTTVLDGYGGSQVVHVTPYIALVDSYQRLEQGTP